MPLCDWDMLFPDERFAQREVVVVPLPALWQHLHAWTEFGPPMVEVSVARDEVHLDSSNSVRHFGPS